MWELLDTAIKKEGQMSVAFADELIELMQTNKKIVAMDADLGNASQFSKIRKALPEQFIQMGIAEANMIGAAAGMSLRGFTPYVHSFAPFASRRVADQVYMSGAYAKNTINIYGSDPGVCAAANGGTHSSYGDISIYRAIPEIQIFDPADTVQLRWLVKELSDKRGVHYIRATRKEMKQIYKDGSTFEIGKGNILRNGNDVVIFTMGLLVHDALLAAEELIKQGISAEVVNLFTIKPLDEALILKTMSDKKLAITFENHSIYGGLGSAVAEVVAEHDCRIPFKRIGVKDRFGQVGSVEFLKKEYGLTCENLVKTVTAELEQLK